MQQITQSFGERARRYLRDAGFNKDDAAEVDAALTSVVVTSVVPESGVSSVGDVSGGVRVTRGGPRPT